MQGGKPILRKHLLAKTIQIKERLNLVVIRRIQNAKTKRFTFRQHHTTGLIQRRLDFLLFLISYKILLKKTDILTACTSDHSPLIFTLSTNQDEGKGKGLWKFNNSLALNSDFVDKVKAHIANTQKSLDKENIRGDQVRQEYLKYEIRKFSIKFQKIRKLKLYCLKKTKIVRMYCKLFG